MAYVSYRISNCDIISPWFVSIVMFIISTVFVVINKRNWSIAISADIVIVISTALLFFGFGEISSRFILFRRDVFQKYNRDYKAIIISNKLIFLLNCISVCILLLYFKRIRDIAFIAGFTPGEDLLLQYIRLGLLQHNISLGPVLSFSTFFLRSLAYVLTFVTVYNNITEKNIKLRSNLNLMFSTVVYLVQNSLSANRGLFIEYFSFVIIIFAILKIKQADSRSIINRRIIKLAMYSFISFLIIFIFLGSLKGHNDIDVISIISLYAGGSILALDKFLLSSKLTSQIFGKESLIAVNHLLNLLNITDVESSRVLEFVNIGADLSTNIYTSLKRFIADFGFVGMYFIQYIIGLFFGIVYTIIKSSSKVNILIILYGILFMQIIYQSIDDQFLVSFLSVTQVLTFFFVFIIYLILIKPKLKKMEADNLWRTN